MNWDFVGVFLIPTKDFTEGRFSSVLDGFRNNEDTWIPEWIPVHPDHPALSTVRFPSFRISSLEMKVDASSNHERWEVIQLPSVLSWFEISTEGSVLHRDLAKQEVYFDLLIKLFDGLGAIYGVADHEFAFEEHRTTREFLRGYHCIHLYSEDLYQSIGEDLFDRVSLEVLAPERRFLRFSRDFLQGMPTDIVIPMHDIVERTCSLHTSGSMTQNIPEPPDHPRTPMGNRMEVPGRPKVVNEPSLTPMDTFGFFLWFTYPKENHTPEACKNVYLDMLDVKDVERLVDLERGVPFDQTKTPFMRSASGADVSVVYGLSEDRRMVKVKTDYLLRKILHLYNGFLEVDFDNFLNKQNPPLKHDWLRLIFFPTSGFPGRGSLGSQFDRPDSMSMIMAAPDTFGRLERPKDIDYMNHLVDLVVENFKPTFAFGHADYNWFVEEHERMPPFEELLWPVTVYGPGMGGKALVQDLEGTVNRGGVQFSVHKLADGTLSVRTRDLRVRPVLSDDGTELVYP